MGILEFFGVDIVNKEKEIIKNLKKNLKESFSRVKEDIDNQKEWIKHIYHDLKGHKNEINSNIDLHESHFQDIAKWIKYLDDSNKHLKSEIGSIEKGIYSKIKQDFIVFNRQIISSLKSYSSSDIENLNKKIVYLEDKIKMLEGKKEKIYDLSTPISKEVANLNKTQQKILNFLYSSSIPVDYKTIAKNLNISVISARVYVKKLKDLGYDIETESSGKKALITISNRQKIKKFYNS